MKLWILVVLLGLGFGLPQLMGLAQPASWRRRLRAFPRSAVWGWPLMLLATVWFLWNLQQENISDFARFKPAMLVGFAGVGLGTCMFVRDFLPVRGLAILLMLLGKVMVDAARWAPSDWRMLVAAWAYVLVLVGMWFTVSPWRMRDWIEWTTETDGRVRLTCGLRLAFGLGVALLGLTVFRAEAAW